MVDAHGDKPPLIKTIKEIKIDYSRNSTKKLLWQVGKLLSQNGSHTERH